MPETTGAAVRAGEWQLAFLAEAGEILSSSLEYEATLESVTRLVVPRLADWCVVDLVEGDTLLRQLAVAHADPAREARARELRRRYPPDSREPHPIWRVLGHGKPELAEEIADAELAARARDAEHLALLRTLGIRSHMVVPLVTRGRALGTLSFVYGESGRRYGLADLALAEELARRAALAIDNARLYREAREAVQARDEFLAVAAHELKTPLTSLRGSTQLMLRELSRAEGPDPSRLRQRLETIDQQSLRLARLVTQLLDVSRIEAGRLALEREMTDLAALVAGVVRAEQATTGRHVLALEQPAQLLASVDPLRLEQVVTNLLENAIKYSPDGGEIGIRLLSPGANCVRLEVRDHGLGVPPEDCERIFDRFYQAHRGRHFAGMAGVGLGLYISKQIVELHGGTIAAEAPPEGGTRIVVTLPVGPAAGGTAEQAP